MNQKKKKKSEVPTAIELNKRGAAGLAKGTQGRARIIPDKTKYDRSRDTNIEKDEHEK